MVELEIGPEGVHESFRLCSVSVKHWWELSHGFYLPWLSYHSHREWYSEQGSSSSFTTASTTASSTSSSSMAGGWRGFGRRGGGELGEVGRAGSNMVKLEGIVAVSVMIGDITGEVRISAGMGTNHSCWFWVSEWTVASEVDGEVGVSTGGSSFRGGGDSSSSASFNVVIGVFISYLCTSGRAGPTADVPFWLTSRPCHLFWYKQIGLLPGMLSLSSKQ